MNRLNASNIAIVRAAFKGSRLAKLDASLAVLEASIAQGSWVTRGAIKASGGFYQGLTRIYTPKNVEVCSTEWYALCGVASTIRFGGGLSFMKSEFNKEFEAMSEGSRIALAIRALRADGQLDKVSDQTVLAWIDLCNEVKTVSTTLDIARPAPTVKPISLSPKVAATLTEMNLDLDLQSIKMANIEERYRDAERHNEATDEWEYVLNNDGTRKQERYHVVAWTDGIEHNRSRFASATHCHACGKRIPSGYFVPVESFDKKSGKLVSMWLGTDCAKKIFGIKDIGIEK